MSLKWLIIAADVLTDRNNLEPNQFVYGNEIYSFPTLEYYKKYLRQHIEQSKMGNNEKDVTNMVNYLLNHKDEISKEDIGRYQDLFNMNNLYNQFSPKELRYAEIRLERNTYNLNKGYDCFKLIAY